MNSAAASYDEEAILLKLQNAQSNLLAVLAESSELNRNLAAGDKRLSFGLETVAAASDAVAPLQTQHIAAKALRSRINRAVSPALLVLDNFALVESLQRRLLSLSDDTSTRYVYKSEEIDKIEWEVLESAITLWIQHFQLAVNSVFLAEKHLCKRVLSGIMDGTIWPACFAKIADKIMAVFFRFGEGVARSSKEPQKLFKLLDMYDSMDKIRSEFFQVFDGESGVDICARFRELQKLLVHAASKVFWEFGLQIEGLEDGSPPPSDGSVPKIVRYAVNYLKCLAGCGYASVMGQALRIEKTWKAGYLSKAEPDENLLREAISNALDALQRNVEAKRSKYKDKTTSHVLAMNTYWYMYMRTRGSELAKLVGEDIMKKKYKAAAEEAAYSYQAQAWGPLVKWLQREEESPRERMEVFTREFEEILRRHQKCYCVQDDDLRHQIGGAVVKIVVPAYEEFLSLHSRVCQGRSSVLAPDSMREILSRIFGGETVEVVKFKRREFRKGEDEEKVDEGGSFGRRKEKERGGERFRRKERGSFGRKGEQGEERENSERNDERKEEEKEERAIVHGRREIKNVEEEEEERVGGDEGRRTMVEGEKRIFRRRREIKHEVENREGKGEEIKREVEEAKTNFRRRRFKNGMEGGSGPLEMNKFEAEHV